MKITVLGSGTSQGVPVIACECKVCKSIDIKDNRLRSAIHIQYHDHSLIIDAGPDFRQQILRAQITNLDAIFLTHEHKDHIAGLDDVRAFNYKDKKPMRIFCTNQVFSALKKEYHYVFSEEKYPGIPELDINIIENKPFKWIDLDIIPIKVMHYKMPVFGFRINDFTYITDAKTISEEELEKVKGTKILIINALHQSHHISHFNLEEALAFIEKVKPKAAYLTHISHLFGKHEDIEKLLPEGVFAAFDGLSLELED